MAKKSERVSVACPHCGHEQMESPAAFSTVCKKCSQHYRVQDALKPAAKTREQRKDVQRVTCPHCGHAQNEPKAAYSTVCKGCKQHYRIEEALAPKDKPKEKPRELRQVACFQCGTELEVPAAAQSTMCKRCSSFVDLKDYRIDHSVTKNFKTKGRFVVDEKGFVFNTDSIVGEAVIQGKLHGKLQADRSLEIHSTADIRGSFKTTLLIIPTGERFRWNETIEVESAEIGGELVANLHARGTITLRSTARMFGDITALNLVVESGSVFVGNARIGAKT